MLEKSLVNHINDLLTCQLNIIVGFGWYCFEQCLNIMTYIKACLKIICFPPCTLDFACACWRKGGGRTKWERLVTSVLISLSRVDNTYWNKSDIVQNNYRATLERPNCASVQNSSTAQHPYTGKSRDRKKKASARSKLSFYTVSKTAITRRVQLSKSIRACRKPFGIQWRLNPAAVWHYGPTILPPEQSHCHSSWHILLPLSQKEDPSPQLNSVSSVQ